MNNSNQPFDDANEMQEEYDFSSGVRGKYYGAYQRGYIIRVEQADGNVVEERVTPPPRRWCSIQMCLPTFRTQTPLIKPSAR